MKFLLNFWCLKHLHQCMQKILSFFIRIYFLYFTYSIFKTLHIRLFILHYISLKYIFFIFKIISFYSHTTTTIHFFFLNYQDM